MIEKLVQRINAAGRVAGTVAYTHKALALAKERGFRFITYGVTPMLNKAGRDYLEIAHSS